MWVPLGLNSLVPPLFRGKLTLYCRPSEGPYDMVTVVGLLANLNCYPDALGYGEQFEAIIAEWRSALKK